MKRILIVSYKKYTKHIGHKLFLDNFKEKYKILFIYVSRDINLKSSNKGKIRNKITFINVKKINQIKKIVNQYSPELILELFY